MRSRPTSLLIRTGEAMLCVALLASLPALADASCTHARSSWSDFGLGLSADAARSQHDTPADAPQRESKAPRGPERSPCQGAFGCGGKPNPAPAPVVTAPGPQDLLSASLPQVIPAVATTLRDGPANLYTYLGFSRIDHPPRPV